MRIWHLAAIVLLVAILLTLGRDPESSFILVILGGMAPGVVMMVACGRALGRLSEDRTRPGNEGAWPNVVGIVLAIPILAFFAILLLVLWDGD
jgi:hypothetical protein